MKYLPKVWMAVPSGTLLVATLVFGVTPNTATFESGQKASVKGVIISRDGDIIKLRGDNDSVDTIDLTNTTKIELKRSFGRKTAMEAGALVPGLHIEAQGKGGDKGDLVAEKVTFDPNSMRASRQIDARVSPLEARTGGLEGREVTLEGRAGQLENRSGQLEGRQNDLDASEKQTQQKVGQVKTEADQANQGVDTVNTRVTKLDNYDSKYSATVYFRSGVAALTPQAKQDLDDIAQKAKTEKGYVVEVAGFADTTGNMNFNQELSQRRADSVIQYLEEKGDIPIHRILTPAGLGTSHEVADNHTSPGRKLNRRVEVKVLVNQGIVSANATSAPTTTTPPAASEATQPTAPSTTPTAPPPAPQQ
jgi:outer membrane protein OmpA-like peptidoglycan-associated protein